MINQNEEITKLVEQSYKKSQLEAKVFALFCQRLIVTIKTQAQLDALPASVTESRCIQIRAPEQIVTNRTWENSTVEARENSTVEAWGNSRVEAWGNSRVEAWENSTVEAWENSTVEAWGNSTVVARENSTVVAWENSRVEARGNSTVEAWGNSTVVAWGNSRVVAWGNVAVRCYSESCSLELWGFAAVWLITKCKKLVKHSKTVRIITPKTESGTEEWLSAHGTIAKSYKVIIYKRVSKDFKTQEGTLNETTWRVGSTLEHPNWKPEIEECNGYKFHGVGRPNFGDEFRNIKGDKYIAIEVAVKDLYAWPNPQYPHKIAFRSGTVLYECDRFGKQLASAIEKDPR